MKVIRLLIAVAALAGISQSAHAAEKQNPAVAIAIKETAAQEAVRLATDIVTLNPKHMTTTVCPDAFTSDEAFKRLTALVHNNEVKPVIGRAYLQEAVTKLNLKQDAPELVKLLPKIAAACIDKNPVNTAWNYMRVVYRNQQAEIRKQNAAIDDVPALLETTVANTALFALNKAKNIAGFATTTYDTASSTSWAGPVARTVATAVLFANRNNSLRIPFTGRIMTGGIKSPAIINTAACAGLVLYSLGKSLVYKNGYINRIMHSYNKKIKLADAETIGGTPDYAAMLS